MGEMKNMVIKGDNEKILEPALRNRQRFIFYTAYLSGITAAIGVFFILVDFFFHNSLL